MKQVELRKVLMVATFFCLCLFVYLYWKQSSGPVQALVFSYNHIYTPRRNPLPPQWTWLCVNQRCERRQLQQHTPVTSLATCSMLCGSTQLWPQPTGPVSLGSKALLFNHNQLQYDSVASGPAQDLIQDAFAIFNNSVYSLVQNSEYANEKTDIRKFLVKVSVANGDIVKLKFSTDESYKLVLKAHGAEIVANITAKTYFGARHGLETLSQLIWWDEYANNIGGLKVLKGATVQDGPAFPYRGLMVDTARNFMPVESLKRVLVGMSANKLNVFHWHVTDSQSFPMVLPNVPQLAKTGSYSPEETYSPEEVKALVEFARVRGIRVLLEVDTPGHAGNGWTWGPEEGLGELAVCVNERPWSLYCGEPPCGQLNPENPKVYDVLEKIYRDLIELSGENEIFHLGGDEVNLECWAQHLQKTNTLSNYTDLHELWGEFTVKALGRLQHANGGEKVPNVIVWSNKLNKRPYITKFFDKESIIVQSWGASQWTDTPDLIADGYRVLVSHVDAWYLDCGFGRWRETGEAACDPYRPWQTVYNHRPWQQMHLAKKQIIGGEVCLWTEQLDETSLDQRLWPRTAAFAERVWTDPPLDLSTYSIQEDVYTRLSTQRERLAARGLKPESLWPKWCAQNPGMCL
ncbi:probable beta-hexosaminidase fdl [Cylas formicarius]|uniref:probable beta-hexosaminidase fdl n=1 Tax=Cylas formicarius TaxID=197179 RepID=UPI0029588167|nr:probable beta-hexosaminidase fdl [Cylas formicarius]XP_060530857.1 probable beta-hexosaminidase fdl [Cylas formicarius]XP_060530867.1 probable beta-hexosaminidase fdl [Cylas formicarius]XP_060530874.1 probable beta-hexosaminidase fdl [Cylas formicarius]XP_060530883.1 probable beta-hexosaminidase fdl [Cylas formicarius]XP_060530892.1 probable beta-hexosaminidase fdl [Cylas formicarius]